MILRRIEEGTGRAVDLDLMVDVSDGISIGLAWPPKMTTICPLGPSAVSPIKALKDYFRDEIDRHVEMGGCPFPVTSGNRPPDPRSPEGDGAATAGRSSDLSAAMWTALRRRSSDLRAGHGESHGRHRRRRGGAPGPGGELLIKAAAGSGHLHPPLLLARADEPVGMCRMCLVEIDTPRGPMMVTACTNHGRRRDGGRH
jgi:hypothetical protein